MLCWVFTVKTTSRCSTRMAHTLGDISMLFELQIPVVISSIRIAELVEWENEAYHKLDPDPFDDRHPGT